MNLNIIKDIEQLKRNLNLKSKNIIDEEKLKRDSKTYTEEISTKFKSILVDNKFKINLEDNVGKGNEELHRICAEYGSYSIELRYYKNYKNEKGIYSKFIVNEGMGNAGKMRTIYTICLINKIEEEIEEVTTELNAALYNYELSDKLRNKVQKIIDNINEDASNLTVRLTPSDKSILPNNISDFNKIEGLLKYMFGIITLDELNC